MTDYSNAAYSRGIVYTPSEADDPDMRTAGIDVGDHYNRIECHGENDAAATELRDYVLQAIESYTDPKSIASSYIQSQAKLELVLADRAEIEIKLRETTLARNAAKERTERMSIELNEERRRRNVAELRYMETRGALQALIGALPAIDGRRTHNIVLPDSLL